MYESLKARYQDWYQQLRYDLSTDNNPLFIAYYKYFYNPSKGSLNDFLNQYSKSRNEFTVIQIGANEGMLHDPIHKYIKRDKWKGVLLEPQSYVFNNFLSRLYGKNKQIHTVCAAIGEYDGMQKLYKIGFTNMRWATGLASFDRNQIQEAYDKGLVKENCEIYGLQIPDSEEDRIGSEEVEVISPKTLIKRYNLDQIDLLMIDAEGFDFEVIRIFDIAKTQPKAIIFENMHLSPKNKKACEQLFETNEYALQRFGDNSLAMKHPLGKFAPFFEAS